MPSVVAPVVHRDDAYFWEAARDGRLVAQRCTDCATLRHPASAFCAACLSANWQPAELSGRGVVFSWVVSKAPDRPEGPGRVVAVVELEEGFALVTNLEGVDPLEDLRELPVEVVFRDHGGGVVLPQFRPTLREVEG